MPRIISFFEKQPQYIQDMVLRMSEDHTASDVIERLNTLGIYPTPDQLGHFRRKHNKSSGRHSVTSPEDTFAERIWQYISAIPLHHGNTWSNPNLGFKGQIWARCASKLCNAGMIEQVATRPARFSQIRSDAEMEAWYDKEVSAK
jgi:hypothetical protein